MSNSNPIRSTWEQALLNKMTSNGKRLAVVKNELIGIKNELLGVKNELLEVKKTATKIESLLGWLK